MIFINVVFKHFSLNDTGYVNRWYRVFLRMSERYEESIRKILLDENTMRVSKLTMEFLHEDLYKLYKLFEGCDYLVIYDKKTLKHRTIRKNNKFKSLGELFELGPIGDSTEIFKRLDKESQENPKEDMFKSETSLTLKLHD